MSDRAGLSIVLPAYNEEDNIVPVLEEALSELAKLESQIQQVCQTLANQNHGGNTPIADPMEPTFQWEILVVNDGSRDQTLERAQRVAQQHPGRVRCISSEANLGYGHALRLGFQAAQFNLVFYTDSDGQFSIGDLRYFLPLIVDHDLVVGFRVYRFDPLLRLFLSWGYNRLVRFLFRVRVRDIDCSFKLMRREVLDSIDLETDDFFIDTELVARARRWNFRIREKGVKHYPRRAGESSLRPSHIPRTLRTVFRMWWRIHFGHWGKRSGQ
ncbi:MAG: glycosyltransferase family 2 protein [bacterium]